MRVRARFWQEARAGGQAQFDSATLALERGVLKFSRKPGHVLVLGDFNMDVGNSSDAAPWDNARAPTAGSPNDPVKVTDDSRRLLHMAEEQDLCFLSGQSPATSGPTCHRGNDPAARSRTTIDHNMASAPLAALIQPEATVTMASGFDSEEVRQCVTDHVPILTACLPYDSTNAEKHHEILRWRTDRLRDADTSKRCSDAIADKLERAAASLDDTPQAHAQALSAAITDTAQEVLGCRKIRPGVTKVWATPELARLRKRRLAAYRAAVTPGLSAAQQRVANERLRCAHNELRAEVRKCRSQWRRTSAAKINDACVNNLASKRTHALLRGAAKPARRSRPPDMLRHPTSDEPCTTIADMVDCFSTHYATLSAKQQTHDAERQSHAAEAEQHTAEAAAANTFVPGQDD
jgi:hypothetical protein